MAGLLKHAVLLLPLIMKGKLCISDSSSVDPERLCTLATPSLTFTNEGVTVNESSNELNIPEGDSLWIGYIQVLQPFFYEGCVPDNHLANTQPHEINASPGQCYSHCNGNTSYVGISNQHCYCLDNITGKHDMFTKKGCSIDCKDQSDVICGGREYVSIYKPGTIVNDVNKNKEGKRCLAVVPSTKEKKWSSCDANRRYMCKKVDLSIRIKKRTRKRWHETMKKCLEDDNLPVQVEPWNENISHDYETYNKSVWSGHIRSSLIIMWNGIDGDLRRSRGYITNNSGLLQIAFTTEQRDWKALCTCVSTTTTKRTTTAGTDIAQQHQNSNNLRVALFVVAPLVAVLAIVALTVFVCWRLKRNRKTDDDTARQHGEKNRKMNTTNSIVNASYEDDTIIKPRLEKEPRHEYFLLEPVSEREVQQVAEIRSHADSKYDVTGAVNKRGIGHETSNVYNNRLDDITYNQTNASGSKSDGTYMYNHIGPEGSDNTYNIAATRSNPKKYMHTDGSQNNDLETTANIYDRIENNSNLYDTTETFSNSYKVAMKIVSKSNRPDDNYSHIDKKERIPVARSNVKETIITTEKQMLN